MEDQNQTTRPRLTFRTLYKDGRVSCLLNFPDGGWKVEIFGSRGAAENFAAQNGYVIVKHRVKK